jgi:hypothetical protein
VDATTRTWPGGGNISNSGPTDADPLGQAADRVRETAKWAAAAYAAIGAILVAGLQLSSIGSLTGSRVWIAAFTAIVALISTGFAVWLIIRIMLPGQVTLSRLSQEDPKYLVDYVEVKNPSLLQGVANKIGGTGGLSEQWTNAIGDRAQAYKQYYKDSTRQDLERNAEIAAANAEFIAETVQGVLSACRYEQVRHEFEARARWLLLTVLVTALAIVGFAWSANPPVPKQAPAALRGASLLGADLRGANLVNADLTNANLKNANLRGANLTGAAITGVKWSHTICPDSINSSMVKPMETCAGHLIPTISSR